MGVRPGYKLTELGVIPEDWEISFLYSLCNVIDGDRGANYPNKKDFSSDGYCLFLNAGNVTKSGFVFEDCAFIDQEKDTKLSKGKLKRGDIVLTTRGTIGNFAYYNAKIPFDSVRINSGMVILRNDTEAIDTDFLYASFQSHLVENQIQRITFGSAQPQLTVKGISKFIIVIPKHTEQRAIAAALTDVEALIQNLDKLIIKKRDIKQAAMQELLTGKKRLPGFCGEWKEMLLGELGIFLKGAGIKKEEALSGNIPCIRYGEIYTHHTDVIKGYFSWISRDVAERSVRLTKGDLLFAGSGETKEDIGKCVAFVNDEEAYAGGDIVILRAAGIDPVFMGYYCNSKHVTIQKASKGQGDAIVHISKAALYGIPISIPSLPEQTAIAEVLSDMDAEIEALEKKRSKTRLLKQGMMQELLTGKTRLI